MNDHHTYTPPTYLPVNKVKPAPGDHVVMNPALRAWLNLKDDPKDDSAGPQDIAQTGGSNHG